MGLWHPCLRPAGDADEFLNKNLWWAISWEWAGQLGV